MNMVGVVRKLTKTIVLSVGTVILGAVCAVGGAGLYFKEDAVKFYTQIRNEVTSISSTLDNGIDQFNKTISEVQTLPENLKTEFAKRQKDFGDIAAKLEQQASELEKNHIKPSTRKTENGSQTAQELRDLATKIKEASNAINTGVNTIAGQVDSVTNSQIVGQIKTFLNTVKTDYLPKVNEITAEVTPEKFGDHVKAICENIKDKDDEHKVVFLIAWNEWGEGNYMEPDLKWGHGYLEALKSVING